jgi:hypothetical protein
VERQPFLESRFLSGHCLGRVPWQHSSHLAARSTPLNDRFAATIWNRRLAAVGREQILGLSP